MSTPGDRAATEAVCASHGLTLTHEPLIVLGCRGALEPNGADNRIGVFDDRIVVFSDQVCLRFIGNTDPSQHNDGEATLCEGIWRFKPGLHHPGTPKEAPCFVQAAPVTVTRWNRPGTFTGEFAIHIHNAMGENTTGSEGCQTVIKHEWQEFYDAVMAELHRLNRADFPYLLVRSS